jgi:hypothetical protein
MSNVIINLTLVFIALSFASGADGMTGVDRNDGERILTTNA